MGQEQQAAFDVLMKTLLELLAVVRFTRMYLHYMLGRKFTVRTDHHSLIWLMSFRWCPQTQLTLLLEELSQFHMVIQHIPGRQHCNVTLCPACRCPQAGGCGTRLDFLVICLVAAARSAKGLMTNGMLLLRK